VCVPFAIGLLVLAGSVKLLGFNTNINPDICF